MRYRTSTAFRTALEARLKAAQRDGVGLSRLRKRVAFERLLARLNAVAPNAWVLKGGFALELRLGARARTTKDIDVDWAIGEDEAVELLLAAPAATLDDCFEFADIAPEVVEVQRARILEATVQLMAERGLRRVTADSATGRVRAGPPCPASGVWRVPARPSPGVPKRLHGLLAVGAERPGVRTPGSPGALVEQAAALQAREEFGGLPDVGDADARRDLPVARTGVAGEVAHDRAGTVRRGDVQRLREIPRVRRRGLGETPPGGLPLDRPDPGKSARERGRVEVGREDDLPERGEQADERRRRPAHKARPQEPFNRADRRLGGQRGRPPVRRRLRAPRFEERLQRGKLACDAPTRADPTYTRLLDRPSCLAQSDNCRVRLPLSTFTAGRERRSLSQGSL